MRIYDFFGAYISRLPVIIQLNLQSKYLEEIKMLLAPNKGSTQGHDKSIQTITTVVCIYTKTIVFRPKSEYFSFSKNIRVPNTHFILMGNKA